MKQVLASLFLAASVASTGVYAASTGKHENRDTGPAPLLTASAQQAFFDNLTALCGKAFAGKVVVDNAGPSSFSEAPLVMHVRRCNDREIQIPFHVGDNASRTWIITRTGAGLTLKHDHRHEDGSHDKVTMYGGVTHDAGWSQVQSFPADPFSKEMFANEGLPQSLNNVWQMYVYPEMFSYRLVRLGREFRVDFDLTKEVQAPAAPWGYVD